MIFVPMSNKNTIIVEFYTKNAPKYEEMSKKCKIKNCNVAKCRNCVQDCLSNVVKCRN